MAGAEVAQDLQNTFSPRTALPFHRCIPILMHPVYAVYPVSVLS